MKKPLIIGIVAVLCIAAGLLYWFVFRKDLSDQIIIPYISHQKPRIDPHVPASVPIADKLDEVLFDGLFNVSANPSGITYEDGLGELVELSRRNIVTVRLKPDRAWHRSYKAGMEKDEITITKREAVHFTADDLRFTLKRIRALGSLSPDYILVGQAVDAFDFSGPDEEGLIRFKFRDDRLWSEDDVKEVLSFKIVPRKSGMRARVYRDGTGPYLLAGLFEDAIYFQRNPASDAVLKNVILKPFIDNSTYTTELKNRNINSLLSIPFGSVAPILEDTSDYFHKSSISTCFFALFHNMQKLSQPQRKELRKLVDNARIVNRFFKIRTPQQRHITDYKGGKDNYIDYLNHSLFPSTSYYVDEKIVMPLEEKGTPDLSILPDTVRIQTCLNYGFREELSELVEILNDPTLFQGKLQVTAVKNDELRKGNYHAVLVAVSGYKSNFLFDLYDIFLREPSLAGHKIHLKEKKDRRGNRIAGHESFTADRNFFRLDLTTKTDEHAEKKKLLEYIHGFMSTHEIGDKQAYAQMLDELDQELALGTWLFSLPSLAYFSTQFDEKSVNLYGVASQLSTIEQWEEGGK